MITTTLGKITDIKTGKLDVNAGVVDGKYPFFTCAVTPYKINEYAFDTEAVLIAGNGDLNVKYYQGKFNAYQRTYVIQNKDNNNLSMKYLYYFVETYMSRLRRDAVGGIIKYIKLGHLTNAEIPLPPLNEQIRIAHLLGKVEGLIAQRKQNLQQLDDLQRSVFLEMFGDPVRNEKGWNTQPFSQVGKFTSGGTPSKSRGDFWIGKYPWVSPKDMKVPKIFDSEDHISAKVFDETSLKRIPPGHLLIVVRGMILAHSFPVAINMVDVAINQDMKAIKLKNNLRTTYVFHCLNALKRQILQLITTAGHGTKKFDADAIAKLLIPVPPLEMQDKFLVIADKIEKIKSLYQQSLIDLESLYGVLSQQVFKGELDLSRVLPPKVIEKKITTAKISFAQETISRTTEKVINELNTFNQSHSSVLKAIQNASAGANFDFPAIQSIRDLAEQASLWKTPLDELKNMAAIARATDALAVSANISQLALLDVSSIRSAAKLAQNIAQSLPKIDMDWLRDQRSIVEAAMKPFSQMRDAMAALTLPENLNRSIAESASVINNFKAALPENIDFMRLPHMSINSLSYIDEAAEPRYIFTRYDILKILTQQEVPLSFDDLLAKLSELEGITFEDYERIKKLVFELLTKGDIVQSYDDEKNSIQLTVAA